MNTHKNSNCSVPLNRVRPGTECIGHCVRVWVEGYCWCHVYIVWVLLSVIVHHSWIELCRNYADVTQVSVDTCDDQESYINCLFVFTNMLSCSAQLALCYRHRVTHVLHEIASCRFSTSMWKNIHTLGHQVRIGLTKQKGVGASFARTWESNSRKYLLNQFNKTGKASQRQSRLISSSSSSQQKRSTIFLLELAPLTIFFKRKKYQRCLSPLVLAAIPDEVFTQDAMFTTQPQPENIFLHVLSTFWNMVLFTVRFIHVVVAFLPVLCLLPMTYMNTSCNILWRRLLLYTVEHMGPTFIKLGQWASTRRDLFSPEFCNLFSKLHTRATEHAWSVTKSNLEKAFGERWTDVLLLIDENPIGSGCIAQVIRYA